MAGVDARLLTEGSGSRSLSKYYACHLWSLFCESICLYNAEGSPPGRVSCRYDTEPVIKIAEPEIHFVQLYAKLFVGTTLV